MHITHQYTELCRYYIKTKPGEEGKTQDIKPAQKLITKKERQILAQFEEEDETTLKCHNLC